MCRMIDWSPDQSSYDRHAHLSIACMRSTERAYIVCLAACAVILVRLSPNACGRVRDCYVMCMPARKESSMGISFEGRVRCACMRNMSASVGVNGTYVHVCVH